MLDDAFAGCRQGPVVDVFRRGVAHFVLEVLNAPPTPYNPRNELVAIAKKKCLELMKLDVWDETAVTQIRCQGLLECRDARDGLMKGCGSSEARKITGQCVKIEHRRESNGCVFLLLHQASDVIADFGVVPNAAPLAEFAVGEKQSGCRVHAKACEVRREHLAGE